jgi:hypothetical protein
MITTFGSQSVSKHKGFLAVSSEPDNFYIGVGVQQHSVHLPHDFMVIYHQNFDVLRCYRIRGHNCLLGKSYCD